jgi:hypothetical protein
MAAFYLKGVAPKHVRLEDIFWGCIPFIVVVLFTMVCVYVFPEIVTWLPAALYDSGGAGGSTNVLEAPSGGFQVDDVPQLPSLN